MAFPAPYCDLPTLEIDVFDSELKCLGQSKSGPVEQHRDARQVDELRQFAPQHILIEKEQGGQGLVLRGCADISIDDEVGEECSDFRLAHVCGVSFAVEQDESGDPAYVRVDRAWAVVLLRAGFLAHRSQFLPRWVAGCGYSVLNTGVPRVRLTLLG